MGRTSNYDSSNCKRFYRIDPGARIVLCGQTFSIQCQVAPAIVIFFMPQSQLFLLSTRIHFTLKVQDHERGLKINGSTVNDGRMWIRKHQFEWSKLGPDQFYLATHGNTIMLRCFDPFQFDAWFRLYCKRPMFIDNFDRLFWSEIIMNFKVKLIFLFKTYSLKVVNQLG